MYVCVCVYEGEREKKTEVPSLALLYFSFSHLHSSFLADPLSIRPFTFSSSSPPISFSLVPSPSHLPHRFAFTRRNSLQRIDHLQDLRTLLGIISYVAVAHSRFDTPHVTARRRRKRRAPEEDENEDEE